MLWKCGGCNASIECVCSSLARVSHAIQHRRVSGRKYVALVANSVFVHRHVVIPWEAMLFTPSTITIVALSLFLSFALCVVYIYRLFCYFSTTRARASDTQNCALSSRHFSRGSSGELCVFACDSVLFVVRFPHSMLLFCFGRRMLASYSGLRRFWYYALVCSFLHMPSADGFSLSFTPLSLAIWVHFRCAVTHRCAATKMNPLILWIEIQAPSSC